MAEVNRNGNQKMPGFTEKREKLTERLLRREEERQTEVEKKRVERQNASLKQESTDYFSSTFQEEKKKIEQKIAGLVEVEKLKMIAFFDDISADIQLLQKFVSDSAMFLPSYELKVALESISKLQNSLSEKRDELLPKKKFAFKSRKRDAGHPKGTVEIDSVKKNGTTTTTSKNAQVISDSGKMECSVTDKQSELVRLDAPDVNGKDAGLTHLEDCVVKIYGAPSTLHVSSLRNCQVFCGPVQGSVFVENCKNCLLVVACQQLRVHTTTDTQFYLHVTSRAVIEDTTRVEFAPYSWTYDTIDDHYAAVGLNRKRNNWDDVDDFNWLASDQHSPNWGLIAEEKRAISWEL